MTLSDAHNFIENWYTFVENFIPNFDNKNFPKFVAKGQGLIKDVCHKHGVELSVGNDTETAYINLITGKITITNLIFNKEFLSKYGPNQNLTSLLIANGCILHEALHHKHTGIGKDLKDLFVCNGMGSFFARHSIKLIGNVFNIIEDIYIENDNCVPDLYKPWIRNLSDLYFTESDVIKTFSEEKSLSTILKMAILYKNPSLRHMPEFARFLGEDLLGVLNDTINLREYCHIKYRLANVETFIGLLSDYLTEEDFDTSLNDDGLTTTDEKTGQDFSEKAAEFDIVVDFDSDMVDEFNEYSESISKKELEIGKTTVHEIKRDFAVKEIDVINLTPYDKHICLHNEKMSVDFVKKLVALRTKNNTPGIARKNGNRINRQSLYRIGTDCKIFSKKDGERKNKKRIEINIVVDCSGSMYANGLIDACMSLVKKISVALRESRVSFSVYGHSSVHYKSNDNPALYHIFSNGMKQTNVDLDYRFEKACGIGLSENYDGIIYDYIFKNKYTGQPATKYMIVLSDGVPQGDGYGGENGVKHAKSIVSNGRKGGINTICLSLVKDVVENNDIIFGSGFNLDATKNLNAQFQNLIEKIVK